MISLDHPLRIVLFQHRGQRLKAAVVEILLDAVGIDHAVVAQGDAALAVEERHVAVELQELAADGLAGHLQPPTGRPPTRCSRMISSSSASFCDAVEDLVGPDHEMGEVARLGLLHAPKQLAWVTRTCSAVKPAARSFSARTSPKFCVALPAAAAAAADEHFVRGDLLDRAVEDVVQHRPALLDCWVKISWTSSRSTRSYLTGIWPGTMTPTIGSRLQRPVQPV